MRPEWLDKQIILFLAADPTGTAQLGREARSIETELALTDHRDCFDFVTRWAAEPLDLLRELRTLKPAVVHFSGHGGARQPQSTAPRSPGSEDEPERAGEEVETGLYFVGRDGEAQWVPITAIANAFEMADTSVKVVVLNASYSDAQADALLRAVPCVIWVPRSLSDKAARSFASGFYGSLGDGLSVDSAFKQGCAAIDLEAKLPNTTELPNTDRPRLRTRPEAGATRLILAANQLGGAAPAATSFATGRPTGRTQRHKNSRWRRVAMRIHTALADGQGAYLLAMLAFGAAATTFYRSHLHEREYHDALASLLKHEQEPYRAETRQVLAAGLLSGAKWDPCENSDLRKETGKVVGEFTTALGDKMGEMRLSGETPSHLNKCEEEGKCPDATPDGDRALTDNAKLSTLIVPSTVADLVDQNPDAREILLASVLIEKVVEARSGAPDESTGRSGAVDWGHKLFEHVFGGAKLKSLYFVHPSGAIRITPARQFGNLPAYQTFAGSSYMYKTLENKSSACSNNTGSLTLTESYFDLIGTGAVRTLCQKIVMDGKVVGILCFDFSPPKTTVCDMLESAARLFDLQLVYLDNDWQPKGQVCSEIPVRWSSTLVRSLADKLREIRGRDHAAGGASALSMIPDDEHKAEEYFGAIVQDMNTEGQRAVVFGTVRRSLTRSYASAVMMVVFATIASGLIVAGVRKKAKRLDVALIRGLQVGVVELNVRDTIVGANDRAQEIFGVELPAFDLPDHRRERPFRSLIQPVIVRLDDGGRLPSVPVMFSRYESLMLERAVGHSSSYYAITTLSKQVIRISGSTFVNRNIEVHTFGTIETFVDPSHRDMVLAAFNTHVDAMQRSGEEGI